MNSSPDARHGEPVLRGTSAREAAAARTAGYADGWAQGRRAAAVAARATRDQAHAANQTFAAHRQAALTQALGTLVRAADEVQGRRVATVEALQDLIVAHAVELAEAIVGRELADPEHRGSDALRRAMRAAPSMGDITVRLHPDDYRNLTDAATAGDYNYEGRPVSLRPDPGLRPGDAVADVGFTTVDATIITAMQRAREVLDQ